MGKKFNSCNIILIDIEYKLCVYYDGEYLINHVANMVSIYWSVRLFTRIGGDWVKGVDGGYLLF